jgi:hypothetical protein
MISVSKKDIFWSYFAEFFSIVSGLITLPLILGVLSPEEVGMNYIMLTIGSVVSLFDFGFGTQFGRNITYVFSGVKTLNKTFVEKNESNSEINYRLLATMIKTAQYVYKRISLVVLFILLTFGTYYISVITNNFTLIKNALIIWIIYSLSIFFNIYYTYYMSLLIGKGMIKESKIAILLSKISNVIIVFILINFNAGLISVALASLVAPFVSRYLSHNFFYKADLTNKIKSQLISKYEINELFEIIWFNAKKMGFIAIAASSLTYLTTFIIGFFLSLSDVASFGLMIQFSNLIGVLAMSLFNTMIPNLSYLYVTKDENHFKDKLSLSVFVFYVLYFLGSVILIYIAPYFLEKIGSNTYLPSRFALAFFLFFNFFEKNQALYSQILLIENKIPFMKTAIITGIISTLFVFWVLYFEGGIEQVVLAQAMPILAYSAWKWPREACKKFKISFTDDILLRGISQFKKIILGPNFKM